MSIILSKSREWIALLRLTPFQTDTPEGRSKERLRRVAVTALMSAFAQGTSLLTMLISVPLTMNYLGMERYGLWIAMSSAITLLGFVDLGIGNGLLNAISESNGRNDRKTAQESVSSAVFIVLTIAILLGIVWILIYRHLSWAWLFNVNTQVAIAEAGPAVSIVIFCMLLSLPFGLVQKIQEGYQEGYKNGFWRAVGSLLGMVTLLIAIHYQAGLPVLVLAMAGSPVVALMLNSIVLFLRQRSWLLPKWNMLHRAASLHILRNGMLFFVLQLAVAISFQSDNLVIARFLGASQVPQYAVPMKLFMLIPSLLSLVIAPLWPAYGEAITRKDLPWVIRIFKRSLYLSFGTSLPLSVFLMIFGDMIIQLWVGADIQPNNVLLLGIGIWVVLLSIGSPIAMFLNGANIIGFQIVCAILMTLGNISLSILLVTRIGIAGPVYGSIISWSLFSLIPATFYIARLFASWSPKEIAEL